LDFYNPTNINPLCQISFYKSTIYKFGKIFVQNTIFLFTQAEENFNKGLKTFVGLIKS